PEAVVDQLGVTRHQLVLEMRGAAVERDLLDAAVRRQQDRAAGRLVHPARLHADETVLDQIEPPDAVRPTQLVEARQQLRWRELAPVDRDRVAAFEIDAD